MSKQMVRHRPDSKVGAFSANEGRGGGRVRPRNDAEGSPITYHEFDVNPYTKGLNRGTEPIVLKT